MNLQKLYASNGPIYINAEDLNKGRNIIPIYTATGRRLADHGRTQAIRESAEFGVHVDNLFASPVLAIANRERIIAEIFGNRHKEMAPYECICTTAPCDGIQHKTESICHEITQSLIAAGWSNDGERISHGDYFIFTPSGQDRLYLNQWGHESGYVIVGERIDFAGKSSADIVGEILAMIKPGK